MRTAGGSVVPGRAPSTAELRRTLVRWLDITAEDTEARSERGEAAP